MPAMQRVEAVNRLFRGARQTQDRPAAELISDHPLSARLLALPAASAICCVILGVSWAS